MGAAAAKMAYVGGGKVTGPGTGTSDSIPVRLSAGEFVIPADSVKKIGVQTLQALVAATHKHVAPKGNAPVRRMVNGGLVGSIADAIRKLVVGGGMGSANPQNLAARQLAGTAPTPAPLSPAPVPEQPRDPNNPAGIQFANGGVVRRMASGGIVDHAESWTSLKARGASDNAVRRMANGGLVDDDSKQLRTYPNQEAAAQDVAQLTQAARTAAQSPATPAPPSGDSVAKLVAQIPTSGGTYGPQSPTTATAIMGAAPSIASAPNPTDQRLADNVQAAPSSAVNTLASTALDSAPGVAKVAGPSGKVLYTNVGGDQSSMFTGGSPTAQNEGAAQALADRYAAAAAPAASPAVASLAGGSYIPGYNAPLTEYQRDTAARNASFGNSGISAREAAREANSMAIAKMQSDAALQGHQISADVSRYSTDTQAATAAQRLAAETPEMQSRAQLATAQATQAGGQVAQQQRTAAAQQDYAAALKSGDAKAIDATEMNLRGQTGHLPLRYEGATLDSDSAARMAEQYVQGDHGVLGNIGRGAQGAQNIVLVQKAIDDYTKKNGLAPQDITANMLNLKGEQAGATAAGKRASQLDMAANEANNALGIVREYSAQVPRTQFQPLNKALNAYRTNTGDPNTVALGSSLNTLVNAYSRAISPTGNPTVNDKQHAEALLNMAQTPEQTEAVLKVMEREIGAAKGATQDVRQGIAARNGATRPLPGATPAPAQAPAQAPAVPANIAELQRRAQSNPQLAQRLRELGY